MSAPDPAGVARDVRAPEWATAWLAVPVEAGLPVGGGYWTNDDLAIAAAHQAGYEVLPIVDADGVRIVRGVTGVAPRADVMQLAAEVSHLHGIVIQLASYLRDAAQGIADPAELEDLQL